MLVPLTLQAECATGADVPRTASARGTGSGPAHSTEGEGLKHLDLWAWGALPRTKGISKTQVRGAPWGRPPSGQQRKAGGGAGKALKLQGSRQGVRAVGGWPPVTPGREQ